MIAVALAWTLTLPPVWAGSPSVPSAAVVRSQTTLSEHGENGESGDKGENGGKGALPAPEFGTLLLVGTGLLGMSLTARLRRKKNGTNRPSV